MTTIASLTILGTQSADTILATNVSVTAAFAIEAAPELIGHDLQLQ